MNPKFYISAAVCMALAMGACSEQKLTDPADGQGRLVLTPSVSKVTAKVESRAAVDEATEAELLKKLHVVISRANGDAIRYWRSYDEMVAAGVAEENGSEIAVNLNTGSYLVEGWTGDSVPASFEHRFFKGSTGVTLEPYVATEARLTCKIANVAANVEYDDEIFEYLSNNIFKIGHEGGSLEYADRDERIGYFMMPAGKDFLDWSLTGSLKHGESYKKEGRIQVKSATLYTFRFAFDPEKDERGAAAIDVVVDEEPLSTVEEPVFNFRTNPDILRFSLAESDAARRHYYELGVNNPLAGQINSMDGIGLFVKSSGIITEVKLTSTSSFDEILTPDQQEALNQGVVIMGEEPVDAMLFEDSGLLFDEDPSIDEEKTTSHYTIKLTADFLNRLPKGRYVFRIEATDKASATDETDLRTVTKQFLLVMTGDNAVLLEEAVNVEPNRITLAGVANKQGLEAVGVKYRTADAETDWADIEPMKIEFASPLDKDSQFQFMVKDIVPDQDYEFRLLFYDEYGDVVEESDDIKTFSTFDWQFPNSGFEDWYTDNKVLYPMASGQEWWDSGNTGSSTLNKNVTEYSTTEYHSGSRSAMLKSQFVGALGIGKFAAGNIFIGKYLATVSMNGQLGWGREYTYHPKSLEAWIKYTPGNINYHNANPYLSNGQQDNGVMYWALLTDDIKSHGTTKDGVSYPIFIDTNNTSTLFGKDDIMDDAKWPNAIAYGEYVLTEATDGWIKIEIPLEYKPGRENERVSYVMLTASASRAGDYFTGSTNSVMYIDDLKICY